MITDILVSNSNLTSPLNMLCSHSTADEVVNVYSVRPCRLVSSVELNMLEMSQPSYTQEVISLLSSARVEGP